jgi:hypothetical protein
MLNATVHLKNGILLGDLAESSKTGKLCYLDLKSKIGNVIFMLESS